MDPQVGPGELQRRINSLFVAQHAASRAQLLALGLTRQALKGRLDRGTLVALCRGVYAPGGSPATPERRWAAGVLASGPTAALSHLSSAACWRLVDVDPVVIDVSVANRSGQRNEGLRTHRPRALDAADVTTHRGIRTTTVARTLIDCAALLGPRRMERMLDEAHHRKLLDLEELVGAMARCPRRRGVARLRATLTGHRPGSTRTINTLEEDFFLLVCRSGLPQPKVNEPLGPYTIDFLWPKERVAVETDGRETHERASARERDYRRDAWLHANGWTPLRFTWRQVHDTPQAVLAALAIRLGPLKGNDPPFSGPFPREE